MKLVLKNTKLIAFFLMAIIYVGCSEDVVELPKMTAGFTYTLNENTCRNGRSPTTLMSPNKTLKN